MDHLNQMNTIERNDFDYHSLQLRSMNPVSIKFDICLQSCVPIFDMEQKSLALISRPTEGNEKAPLLITGGASVKHLHSSPKIPPSVMHCVVL